MKFLLLAFLAACTPAPEPLGREPKDTDETTTPTTPTTPTVDTSPSTTNTGETGTPPVPFDCTQALPTSPVSSREVDGGRGTYDLAMDDVGYLYGWDVGGLRKVDAYGNSTMVTPAVGNIQGMAWLPDGDLAVSEIDSDAILRVNVTSGAVSLITGGVSAYGLKLGPDGMLWAGTDDDPGGGKLVRVDPVTGEGEVLIADPRFNVRSIDFNPDFTKLYMGTYFGDGRLWVVDLDASYNPIGDAYVFNPSVGNGTEHDALGVDYCGNVFVVDYGTLTLYRLTPDGQKSEFAEFGGGHYGHGITWGSGVAGWNEMAIYLPEPWYGNTVFEIELGVPSRSWTP